MENILSVIGMFILALVIHLWTGRKSRVRPLSRPEISNTTNIGAALAELHPLVRDIEERQAKRLAKMEEFDRWMLEMEEEEEAVTASANPTSAVDTGPSTRIHFKPDEPRSLLTYGSQPNVVKPLDMAIKALSLQQVVLDHKLLTGPPGLGKTLLSKVIANELQLRATLHGLPVPVFVETYAANLNSVAALDQVVRTLVQHPASIWFIDEIHVLNKELATKIYLLMEEGRYPFDGSLNPVPVPNVMIIGATTDYGVMHAALKRRFGESLMLRPMSRDELEVLATKLGFPITAESVTALVSRCWQSGAPWELKTLFNECMIFATAHGHTMITPAVVDEVFTTFEIDPQGLRPVDRSVLSALFKRPRYRGKAQEFYCFGGSESDVCAVTKLDKAEFQETIRPRLLSRGLIEVRAGVGLALTDHAISTYAALRQA